MENDSTSPDRRAFRREGCWLALFLLAYFLLSVLLHQFWFFPEAHWSGDSALKALQAEVLHRSDFQRLDIPYRSSDWDPQGRFFPFRPPFAKRIEGRYYSAYPLAFPALLALLKALCGAWAGAVLVALGSTGLLGATYALARQAAPGRAKEATLLVAFGSPVWLYSALLWEHTLASALFLWGAVALVRGLRGPERWAWLLGGVALGATTWVRTEGYALAAAALVATLLWSGPGWRAAARKAAWLLAGFLLALAPWVAFQWWVYGQPWGVHGEAVVRNVASIADRGWEAYLGPAQRRWYRLRCFESFLFRSTGHLVFSLQTAVPFVLFGVTALVPRLRRWRAWVLLNLGLILIVLARVLWEVLSTDSRRVSGLFIVMPYSVLAFWHLPLLGRWRQGMDGPVRFLLGLVGAFFLLSMALNPGNRGGLQWGPRYWMPVFGVLAVLTLKALDAAPVWATRPGRALVGGTVAVAVVFQLVGFGAVRRDEKVYSEVIESLRRAPAAGVVGYDKVWLCQLCAPLYFEKDLYYAAAPGANRSYFSDVPSTVEDFLAAPKPFSNGEVLVLTRGKPLTEQLSIRGGDSREVAPGFWVWRPTAAGDFGRG